MMEFVIIMIASFIISFPFDWILGLYMLLAEVRYWVTVSFAFSWWQAQILSSKH